MNEDRKWGRQRERVLGEMTRIGGHLAGHVET